MNSTGFGTTQEVGEPPVKIMSSTPPVTHARKNPAGSIALRPKQLRVLMAVRRLTARLGVPPARSELAKELGLQSQGSIDGHLLTLSGRGWLAIRPGIERGIILCREGAALYEPKKLCASATQRDGREEGPSEPEWIDDERLWAIFGQVPDLCLWIRGNAMDQAGLTDGGIVALARKLNAQGNITIGNGNMVAARIEGEVVLRRVREIDEMTFELRAESTSRRHKTVRVERETKDVEIIGVVIGRVLAGAG